MMTVDDALDWANTYQNGFDDDPVIVLVAEVRRLREENERLRKDAERYRFLRELAKSNSGITQAQAFFWNCGGSRKQLDMAIDDARGGK